MTMGTVERSARIGVMGVCLDTMSYEALSHFMGGIPGAVIFGNLDHYVGIEREIVRAVDLAQTRICFIDYDRNTEEAIWMTERLRSEYPDVHSFAVSSYSEPEAIIAAMRARPGGRWIGACGSEAEEESAVDSSWKGYYLCRFKGRHRSHLAGFALSAGTGPWGEAKVPVSRPAPRAG